MFTPDFDYAHLWLNGEGNMHRTMKIHGRLSALKGDDFHASIKITLYVPALQIFLFAE
jgi:hypothetical protein